MKPVRINENLSVSAQISAPEVAESAALGFTGVINNRPDNEEPGQPASDTMKSAATEAGLAYAHIPVRGPAITEATVRTFQAALAESEGPVLAYCRSGTRSLTLWTLGEVLDGRMAKDDVVPFGIKHGFDLTGALAWLNAHGH